MYSRRSTIARRPLQEASASTTPPPPGTTPERPRQAVPRGPRPTPSDATLPAESVRVTDRPASTGGRAYLVERGLQTKGELDALILDYLEQAAKLDSPPLAAPPPVGNAGLDHEGPAR